MGFVAANPGATEKKVRDTIVLGDTVFSLMKHLRVVRSVAFSSYVFHITLDYKTRKLVGLKLQFLFEVCPLTLNLSWFHVLKVDIP